MQDLSVLTCYWLGNAFYEEAVKKGFQFSVNDQEKMKLFLGFYYFHYIL